jgi:hypothetical protein
VCQLNPVSPIAEERRSHQHCGGSLKLRMLNRAVYVATLFLRVDDEQHFVNNIILESFLGVSRQGSGASHPTPSRAESNLYPSWTLGMYRDLFTLYYCLVDRLKALKFSYVIAEHRVQSMVEQMAFKSSNVILWSIFVPIFSVSCDSH